MKLPTPQSAVSLPKFHVVTALVCAASLVSPSALFSQEPAAPAQSQVMTNATVAPDSTAPEEAAPKIPNDQLDSLVAPIALYPDPLLAQTLAASTYPLEVIQLEQWLKKNTSLKGKALTTAVEGQKWDPSVQSMAALPDVVKQLSENISWTTDLGNAFLSQQSDVMDAVQRMRAKAQGAGSLKSSQQQKVETQTVESKQVIVIQPADPEVVYVPQYNPTVVYGAAPYYPYPSMYYPPGYGMLAFGAGIAIGAAWGNGGWGYGCGWGNGDVTINNNNNFVNHYNKNNINNGNRPNGGQGNGKWQHSAQHRGGAPYGDRGTANKYGGNARQQPAGANRPGSGAGAGNRPGSGAGAGNRPGGGAGAGNGGAGNRPGGGGGAGNAGAGNRPGGGASAGNRPGGGAGAATRPSGGGGGRASTMPAGGGANRVGNQNLGGGSSSSRGGGFGGGGGGSSARASSSRGGSSMGGGGMSRGGGGGGGRGGGGGGGRRR